MAPVCKFWQQGTCRNGDRCRFEHPSDRNAPSNRFAVLDHYSPDGRNGGAHSEEARRTHNNATSSRAARYHLDRDLIIADLSTDRPQWVLSAYGPGRQVPVQLFGGPIREQSFEEMRLLHYMGVASGNPQQAIRDAETLVQASELQMQTALNDPDGAINFIINGENDHPNRLDIVSASVSEISRGASASSAFGQPATQASNPFGAPSKPASTNHFGAPSQPAAFGAPSTSGTAGVFGQPSSIGQNANPFGAPSQPGSSGGFGQPSAPGQTSNAFGAPSGSTAGAFGQTSALGQTTNPVGAPSGSTGAFGQPSALGQKPSPFGAPSSSAGGAFGQPSSLGQKPSPFGAPSGPAAGASSTPAPFSSLAATAGGFGQASQTANSNPFGTPSQQSTGVFGQPSLPAQTTQPNPFGQPAQQQSQAVPFQPSQVTQPNPFGQPSASASNPFSSTEQPKGNPFGTPASSAPFGAPSQSTPANPPGNLTQTTASALGAPSTTITTGGFGQPSAPAGVNPFTTSVSQKNPLSTAPAVNPFAGASQAPQSQPAINGVKSSMPYDPNATFQHPPLESYTSKDGSGRLTMFKGRPVRYKDDQAGIIAQDGSWQKIWFPEGPPPYDKNTEIANANYSDAAKKAYMHMREARTFANGIMPVFPPKREWCLWDF